MWVKYLAYGLYYGKNLLIFAICRFPHINHLCFFFPEHKILILVSIFVSTLFSFCCLGIFNGYSISNDVILGVCILKICQAKFSKLIFNEVLSYEVLDILLPKFYIYLKRLPIILYKRTWTRYYQNNMLVSFNTYMCWRIYFYRTCISVYQLCRTWSSLFHSMMTDGKNFFLKKCV